MSDTTEKTECEVSAPSNLEALPYPSVEMTADSVTHSAVNPIVFDAGLNSELKPDTQVANKLDASVESKTEVKPSTTDQFLAELLQSIGSRSYDQRLKDINKVIEIAQKYKQDLESLIPALPKVGDDYPLFTTEGHDPYEWLSEHWGGWLKHFTLSLDRDYLFLDQLGKLDPELKKALYAKRRRILANTGYRISEIIPKKSARIDMELAAVDQDELKAAVRLYTIPHLRRSRKTPK